MEAVLLVLFLSSMLLLSLALTGAVLWTVWQSWMDHRQVETVIRSWRPPQVYGVRLAVRDEVFARMRNTLKHRAS